MISSASSKWEANDVTLICFTSQKGAPGATLTALTVAASWPGEDTERRVFLEADRAGGAVALRYGIGTDPGLLTLATSIRSDNSADIWSHAQQLPGGLPGILAPDAPQQVSATLAAANRSLGRWLEERHVSVLADVGRLGDGASPHPLLSEASLVAVVARPIAEQLQPAVHAIRSAGIGYDRVGWVLIGDRPHPPAEVEATFGIPVLGVIADDARTAAGLSEGSSSRRIAKSPLVRSAASLAEHLAAEVLLPEAPAAAINGAVK